jgi:hypothetical protein
MNESKVSKSDLQAELGEMYPPEFLTAICGTAEAALDAWMNANQVPPQVMELVQDIVMLERATTAATKHAPQDQHTAAWVVQELPRIMTAVAELGGEFHYPGGVSARDALAWPGLQSVATVGDAAIKS